jgi:hypothetical protein
MGVTVSGNCAFEANYIGGMRIYDISAPTNPIVVCQFTTNNGAFPNSGYAVHVAASGHYAYLANTMDGLRIYDVTDPANPVNISHTNDGGIAYAVAVSGYYACLANGGDGLRIFDVSNPASPINIGHPTIDTVYSSHRAITVAGNYAYVGNTSDGLHIYDVSDLSNPIEAGSVNNGQYVRCIAVSGNYAYVACDTDGLRIYSLGFPATPPLGIAITTTNTALLSWPAPSPAFVVQRNADLGAGSWVDVSNSQTVVAGRNEVVLPLAAGSRFYHLKSP